MSHDNAEFKKFRSRKLTLKNIDIIDFGVATVKYRKKTNDYRLEILNGTIGEYGALILKEGTREVETDKGIVELTIRDETLFIKKPDKTAVERYAIR